MVVYTISVIIFKKYELRKELAVDQPVFLTKDAFDTLLANLLEIEEGIYRIMDDFFPEPTKEADQIKQIMNDYVGQLSNTINNISTMETATNEFPYVIVGCEVVVEDADNRKAYHYKLVSPLKNKIDINEISFLSPMGKALLLKKVGDSFTVEAPGGKFDYKVLSIKVTADSKTSRFNFKWVKGGA
jgi:transcription elongation factor GreA